MKIKTTQFKNLCHYVIWHNSLHFFYKMRKTDVIALLTALGVENHGRFFYTIGLRGPPGYDAGKKIKRRKRHLFVDTQILMLKAKVYPAHSMDCNGVILPIDGMLAQFPQLHHVWLDAGYNGKGKDRIENIAEWIAKIVQHPPKPRSIWLPKGVKPERRKLAAQLLPPGFHVSPQR